MCVWNSYSDIWICFKEKKKIKHFWSFVKIISVLISAKMSFLFSLWMVFVHIHICMYDIVFICLCVWEISCVKIFHETIYLNHRNIFVYHFCVKHPILKISTFCEFVTITALPFWSYTTIILLYSCFHLLLKKKY